MITKKLIKKYKYFNLYGIYKDEQLLYKTCNDDMNLKRKFHVRDSIGYKI